MLAYCTKLARRGWRAVKGALVLAIDLDQVTLEAGILLDKHLWFAKLVFSRCCLSWGEAADDAKDAKVVSCSVDASSWRVAV